MSRTFKDVPRQVRINRLPLTREYHHGCRHSLTGGVWRWRTKTVHHEAEWHLVTQWRMSGNTEDGGHFKQWWTDSRDPNITIYRTRQVWRYSAWDERIWVWTWTVRECDLEGGADTGHPCEVEHYGTTRQEDLAKRYRQGERWEDRRIPSRRVVRNALRAAVVEFDSRGDLVRW